MNEINQIRLRALEMAKEFHYNRPSMDDEVIETAEKFLAFLTGR